jgi:hypothetical protein
MSGTWQALDPDHVYLNINSVAGASTTFLSTDPLAQYAENRNSAVITEPSQYKLAVVRVDLTGNRNLPLFIPSIATGQPNPWLTNYAITAKFETPAMVAPTVWPTTNTESLTVIGIGNPGSVFPFSVTITPAPGTDAGSFGTSICTAINQSVVPNVSNNALGEPTLTLTCGQNFSVYAFSQSAALAYGFEYSPSSIGPWVIQSTQISGSNWAVTFPRSPFLSPAVSAISSSTASLIWSPQTVGLLTPTAPLDHQEETVAYWTYDYQWFVKIFNAALASAINAALPSILPPPLTSMPSLVYSGSSKTFSLVAQASLVPTTATGYPQGLKLTLQFNELLQNLLMLPAQFDYSGNAQIDFTGAVPIAGTELVSLNNDFSPVASLWSPIQSIVFTATRYNARSELNSANIPVGTGNVGFSVGTSTSYETSQVLSDVIPNQTDASDWRAQTTLYSPTVLRWVDMTAAGVPLTSIDFGLAWRNRYTGSVIPLTMNPLSSFGVKLVFKHKGCIDA